MVDFPAKYVILLESGWKKEHLQLQGFEFWMVFFPSERDSSGTFAAKWTDGLFLLSIIAGSLRGSGVYCHPCVFVGLKSCPAVTLKSQFQHGKHMVREQIYTGKYYLEISPN